jgi:hypothetical protein
VGRDRIELSQLSRRFYRPRLVSTWPSARVCLRSKRRSARPILSADVHRFPPALLSNCCQIALPTAFLLCFRIRQTDLRLGRCLQLQPEPERRSELGRKWHRGADTSLSIGRRGNTGFDTRWLAPQERRARVQPTPERLAGRQCPLLLRRSSSRTLAVCHSGLQLSLISFPMVRDEPESPPNIDADSHIQQIDGRVLT